MLVSENIAETMGRVSETMEPNQRVFVLVVIRREGNVIRLSVFSHFVVALYTCADMAALHASRYSLRKCAFNRWKEFLSFKNIYYY